MSTRPLVIYPDPILSRKCAEVTEFSEQLQRLVSDMLETMYHEEGIGLAAPQIGADLRVFVSDVSRDGSAPLCVVNPVIVQREGTIQMEEGCLSIPGYRAKVTRSAAVRVEGLDARARPWPLKLRASKRSVSSTKWIISTASFLLIASVS